MMNLTSVCLDGPLYSVKMILKFIDNRYTTTYNFNREMNRVKLSEYSNVTLCE
ncbi:hypothetical protein SAMN05421687_103175 [Salimicrobium flavidum]|uniref:Uncharacterized protein n=1 Tax=Salimicrobium flavidum TaxID=570947 RepID=A0A1N7J1J3_9BACI|nr:hypothetical protein SAMN05421687_103175 [Salimicrobium flavidum]